MNWKKVNIVYRKEIMDTLRDKRTVMMMILVPILIYPMLFTVMSQIMTAGVKKLENESSVIALNDSLPEVLKNMITPDSKFEILSVTDPVKALETKGIHGYLTQRMRNDTLQFVVYYDAALDKSRLSRERLTDVLWKYRRQEQERLLSAQTDDLSILDPFAVESENIAAPGRMGGWLLGSIIPMLLIMTMVLGAMYPAIDLTAGEKERGTLETILTIPVGRLELLAGKFFTVTTTALITALLNLASMMAVYSSGLIQIGELGSRMEFGITPYGLFWLTVSLIPFALFISAAIISVCLFARSFKEAQNFVTPVYLLIMFPSFIAFMPGVEMNRTLSLIPVVNISLLFREIFLSNYPLELISLTFISNAVIAALFIMIVVKLFNAESILFGEGQAFHLSFRRSQIKPTLQPEPVNTLLLFSVVMLLLFYVGSLVQLRFRSWGVFITEWVLIGLPVALTIWYFKTDFRKSLNIRKPSWIAMTGTVCCGLGGIGVITVVSIFQLKIFPESMEILKSLEKILNMSKTPMHPVAGYLIFAVSPAICEEALFRGMILSSLKKRIPAWMTIVLTGFLFGVFHVHLIRLLPTALMGVLFTYIVYRTGSIWTSVIAHLINNGIVFTLINFPGLAEKLPWLTGETWPSPVILAIMGTLLFAGIVLIEIAGKSKDREKT